MVLFQQPLTTFSNPSINRVTTTIPDFESDFSDAGDWTKEGTVVTVTGGKAKCSAASINNSDRLHTAFTALSDSKWTARVDMKIDSLPTNLAVSTWIGDGTGIQSTGDNFQLVIRDVGGVLDIRLDDHDGGVEDNGGDTAALTYTTQYFLEISRTTTTNWALRVYTDSAHTAQVGSTVNKTCASTIVGFDNIHFGNVSSGVGTATYEFDNIAIYNNTDPNDYTL